VIVTMPSQEAVMPGVAVVDRPTATRYVETHTWADRLGMPGALRWGYIGLLIFMIGDGVEAGYLAKFLLDGGLGAPRVGLLFTVYGVAAGVAAWASGALSDLWGPRRVMMIGLALWVGFQVLFLAFALPNLNYPLMLAVYGLRGLGYPLFAFGFLVWIAAATPLNRLGTSVGWFWFAFTGGLPTLGSVLASLTSPVVGQLTTLWIALGLVVAGGLIALLALRERTGFARLAPEGQRPLATLAASLTIMWQQPKIGIGASVRAINTASEYGFLIFMPTFFTQQIGFTLSEWLLLLSVIFLSNIFFNLFFGVIGDKVGWRRTVALFGGIGCAITTLAFYYVPLAVGRNLPVAMLVGAAYGATLAGFVPLSALMPSLAPDRKGAAMSALNFGAGVSVFLGPLIVTIFLGLLGVAGVMWVFAALYVLSAVLAMLLKLPHEIESAAVRDRIETGHPIGSLAAEAGETFLGHPPEWRVPREDDDVDLILFDVGGPLYDDDAYAQALRQAVGEIDPTVSDRDFWAAYYAQAVRSSGSLRTTLAERFAQGDRARLSAAAARHWEYPPDSLYPDVRPTLSVLASRYRLGLVANSGENVLDAMRRDGIADLFSVLALAPQVGVEKPDPAIFRYALDQAGVPAVRAMYVGNRLDSDIRPARALGMRTAWLLRGEAPPAPTPADLDEPDAVITSLTGLPIVLIRLTHAPGSLAGASR
jgi:polyol permease family/HAD superfamily hydrolase (TIGR01549 family)